MLSGWSRQIHTEFHGLGATWETRSGDNAFSCTGLSPSTATPSRGLPLTTLFSHSLPGRQPQPNGPTTPTTQRLPAITCNRFSLIRFRSPLLTESRLFSLPVGTEMFHFPRSLHTPYVFKRGSHHMTGAGFPHSEILGSTLGWQLPEAYRSLLRPSSAPGAQASTVCP